MAFITLILGIGIGFIAGTGLWRKSLARLGAYATELSTVATPLPFGRTFSHAVNAREKKA